MNLFSFQLNFYMLYFTNDSYMFARRQQFYLVRCWTKCFINVKYDIYLLFCSLLYIHKALPQQPVILEYCYWNVNIMTSFAIHPFVVFVHYKSIIHFSIGKWEDESFVSIL